MSQSARQHPNRRVLRRRLLAAAFGLLLALGVAELALRAFDSYVLPLLPPRLAMRLPLPFDNSAIDSVAAGHSILMLDPDLGWVPTPDGRATNLDWLQQHNRAGLRADVEYSPTPGEGVRRFAAYGDSFTYCTSVDLADCWTDRLERQLPNTEVLNFGVPGYAPDQAWLRYQRGGASWQPCTVLIGHMVDNVHRVVNRFRPFLARQTSGLPKPRFRLEDGALVLQSAAIGRPVDLKDPVWIETTFGPGDAWYFPGVFVPNPLDRFQLVRVMRTAAWEVARRPVEMSAYQPGSEPFEVLIRVLVGFAEQVRADGPQPIVLIFPDEGQLEAWRDNRPRSYAPLLAALQQHAIPTIDLGDVLGEQARASGLHAVIDGHYRPMGNRVVAETLAARLPHMTAETCPGSRRAAD